MPRASDPFARNRLIESARDVFSERGLDRAKVEDIAQRAGLSKGAFYLHFESKDEAFREVVRGVLDRLGQFLDEDACQNASLEAFTSEDFLDEWVETDLRIFEYIWENRTLVRLTLEGGRSADYQHMVEHFAERVQKHIQNMLRIGMEASMYRADLNIATAACFIAGGYDRFARQLVRDTERPDLRSCLRDLQGMVLRGVGSFGLIDRMGEQAPRSVVEARAVTFGE